MFRKCDGSRPKDPNELLSTPHLTPIRQYPTFPDHLTFSLARAPTRKIPRHESIHAAAKAGCVTDVSLFISQGVDVNAVDSTGDAPIHYACISSHRRQLEVVKMLLANGANPVNLTITGQTVVHLLAVHSTSPSTLQTLRHLVVSAGVDINLKDEINRTPLAYFLGRYQNIATERVANIVKFFILNGARGYVGSKFLTNLITECSILTKGDSNTELYRRISNVYYAKHPDELPYLHCRTVDILGAEHRCSKEWFVWGNCILSMLSFLRMSEQKIAAFARKEPLFYFAITQNFRNVEISRPSKNWQILHYHYHSQFNIFCYYFVAEQLKYVRLTDGDVALNYDCLRTIASFLSLKDLVNLCVAFNFDQASTRKIRKLNKPGNVCIIVKCIY